MPNKLTEAEIQKLIPLVEQTKFHYRLDKFTDESLGLINKSVNQARREVAAKLAKINPKSEFTKQRLETLAQELQDMTVAIQHKITGQIENVVTEVAAKSYKKHADILSFGGLVPNFNNVQLTSAQLKSIVDTPVGGKLLDEWVSTVFTANLKEKYKTDIATGMLKGESYKNLVKRFKTDAFEGLERDMEGLTRTYVQTINTNAMNDIMMANADIMKGWKWNSVYENRTCIRCMAMDAKDEIYPIDGGPQIPLHVNCRCFPEPITKTFRELGVDIDEVKDSYRPYTIRGKIDPVTGRVIPGKIGVGGGRIIDTGRFLGSYDDFFKQLPENVQMQMLGPTRFGLHKAGKLPLSKLADAKGNAYLIKELTGEIKTLKAMDYASYLSEKSSKLGGYVDTADYERFLKDAGISKKTSDEIEYLINEHLRGSKFQEKADAILSKHWNDRTTVGKAMRQISELEKTAAYAERQLVRENLDDAAVLIQARKGSLTGDVGDSIAERTGTTFSKNVRQLDYEEISILRSGSLAEREELFDDWLEEIAEKKKGSDIYLYRQGDASKKTLSAWTRNEEGASTTVLTDPDNKLTPTHHMSLTKAADEDYHILSGFARQRTVPGESEVILMRDAEAIAKAAAKKETKVAKFIPAKTIKETEEWASSNVAKKVNYSGLDVDVANEVNKALHEMVVINGYGKLDAIVTTTSERTAYAFASGNEIRLSKLMFKKSDLDSSDVWMSRHAILKKDIANDKRRLAIRLENLPSEDIATDRRVQRYKDRILEKTKLLNEVPDIPFGFDSSRGSVGNIIVHEYGHTAESRFIKKATAGLSDEDGMALIKEKYNTIGSVENRNWFGKTISEYGMTDPDETIAEAWAVYHSPGRNKLNKTTIDFIEKLIKWEKK